MSELKNRATRLSKERDSAVSKMNLWMKTCKQLEQEKQKMLNTSGINMINTFKIWFTLKAEDYLQRGFFFLSVLLSYLFVKPHFCFRRWKVQ